MEKLKIIACVDFQCDFLANGLLAGLYETGHDIYEVPALKHVRGGVDDQYILPDGKTGMTGPPGYLAAPAAWLPAPHSYGEAVDVLKKREVNLVVMLSDRDYARKGIDQLSRDSGWSIKSMPLVLCNGEDYDFIDTRTLDEFAPKVFFKREIPKETRLDTISRLVHRPVWPMPFSAFTRGYPEIVDDAKKDYDLFLSLGDTYPARRLLTEKFLEASDKGKRKSHIAMSENVALSHPLAKKMKKMLPWPEYITTQARSRITASIRGFGRDALHAWEAFSFATLVLYCDPQIHIPFPFEDRIHCVHFEENCASVVKLIDDYLEDSAAAWQLAHRGKQHLWQHHTNKARAEYLIEVAMGEINGRPKEYADYQL